MRYYAIEIIGGRTLRYVLRSIHDDRGHAIAYPVDGKGYKTLEEAQERADALGIKIEKIGTIWEIM